MERRKFIMGAGSLAAGSAAAMGTGAFSSVTASRNVDVAVAGDANAYLRIEGRDDPNGEYIAAGSDSGTLTIDLDGDDSTPGSGVNPDALTQIDDLFVIENQGTQQVEVALDKTGSNAGLVGFYANDAANASATYDASTGTTTKLDTNSVDLDVGESVVVSIQIDTTDSGLTSGDTLLDSVTITAEA